jgi:hypothetical protein
MLRPAFGVAALALALTAQASAQEVSANDAYEIAEDAYVYAYPLMVMDASVRQLSNFAEPTGIVTQAPFNQFSHAQAFPPADYKGVVRANADTLYSTANLDLGPEPIVLSAFLQRDLPTCHALAIRSLRLKVGGPRSLGNMR